MHSLIHFENMSEYQKTLRELGQPCQVQQGLSCRWEEASHLNVFQSADGKILIWPRGVEHDAGSELIAAGLLSKASLEAGLSCKFTCITGT